MFNVRAPFEPCIDKMQSSQRESASKPSISQVMDMEEQSKSVRIVEVCKVSPSSQAEFSLPLTYFDLMFLHIPPTQYILFYSLTTADPPFFDYILPKLKHSLSLALSYFLPLAGNIIWPSDSLEPFILYKPGDAVLLTVVETDDHVKFSRLSKYYVQKAIESHSLLPELELSNDDDTVASIMSLQITLFLNSGFSIGVKTNHVVVDGKTTTMFLKSWAYICKLNVLTLLPELTPSFDRTAVKDPSGIDKLYVKNLSWITPSDSTDSKVRKLGLASEAPLSQDVARYIFELTRADIDNMRKKMPFSQTRYLSSFVLAYAYVSTCMIKAQKIEGNRKIALTLLVDWRPHSELPVPIKYFGNGVSNLIIVVEAREFEEENGIEIVANKINDAIVELKEKMKKKTAVEILEEGFLQLKTEIPNISKAIAVAGSPKFGVYEIDFGWGSCKKVEMTSLSPGGTISFAESRNGNGGLEVGIALPSVVMIVFASLLANGLK